MDILKIVFIIFLAIFSFGETIRFRINENFFLKPLDLVMVTLFLLWIPIVLRSLKAIFKDVLFIPISLFIFAMTISLAFNIRNFSSDEILVAFLYILRWVLYASLYFVVKNFSFKFKKKILFLLLLTGGLFLAFGFMQYFLYPNLRNLSYLGWDEHMVRLFSTFLDPNFSGAFYVLTLIFSLSVFFLLKVNKKLKLMWVVGIFSVINVIAIFLSYSRSALVMLLVSSFVYFVSIKKLYWFFGIILFLIIFILASLRNFDIENINLFRTASSQARIDSANTAIEIIKSNLIIGVGFNTYRYAQIKHGFRSSSGSVVSHADAGTDNSFLYVLATTGIVGLILYLNLLLAILRKSYETYKFHGSKEFQKNVSIVIISSIAGLIFNSFFINSLFYSFILIWIWILLGIISSSNIKIKENS
ncbi:MAG: O-antigen ligase family protein [Candidatus Levybacteria bacterium]|nr:O-antigen ligase family protein [Candidatus Levybacteria bacterium]